METQEKESKAEIFKAMFGHSLTADRNMRKAEVENLNEYKALRKARKQKEKLASQAKRKKALQGRKAKVVKAKK
jgi:hypothetical protein